MAVDLCDQRLVAARRADLGDLQDGMAAAVEESDAPADLGVGDGDLVAVDLDGSGQGRGFGWLGLGRLCLARLWLRFLLGWIGGCWNVVQLSVRIIVQRDDRIKRRNRSRVHCEE